MSENSRALIFLLLVAALFFFRVPDATVEALEPVASASTTPPVPEVAGAQDEVAVVVPVATPQAIPLPAEPAPTLPAPGIISSPSPSPTPVSSPSPASTPQPSAPSPQPAPATAPKISVVAWMHAQDWNKAVESIKKNVSVVGEVAPAWYAANADGTISTRATVDDPTLLQTARNKGLLVRPLVMSVPGAGATPAALISLLKNKDLRKKQIETLAKLAVEKGYNGFDLDFESIQPANLPDLATYVEELASALHAKGKTLAVSIETHPNEVVLPHWKRIGAAADSVRLMAYGKQSKTPAPITDLAWMRARVQHALKAIPKEKLTVGLPLYCLRWQGATTRSNTWERYHAQAGESTVCETASSVKEKVDIARELGVTNVAFWRLGGEDPAIWEKLR